MAEACCTKAVYDSTAGWWCPDHGDPDISLADRHADLDVGELGMMADADYYDRISGAGDGSREGERDGG